MTASFVLAVDDDIINLDIIREILEESHEVTTATDGERALAILEHRRPDIILLDIMMPGLDGLELCRRIRADRRNRYAKIILVSGKASVRDRLSGYEAGADDYITKPFVDDELLAKVEILGRLSRSEELDALKSEVLQLMTHETRTPLNGILGLAGLLTEQDDLPAEVREYAQDILASGQQLLDFVRKAQSICELRAGRSVYATVGNLGPVVQSTVAKWGADHPEVAVTVSAPPDVEATADWQALGECLVEILDNAVRHGPEQG
ncbi:response regulator, partial [bacterium]|nr:response regulator [bacterium]